MQGKIKNFRYFIYRRSPYNAIISDLQVKIPHTQTLTHFGFTKGNLKMLNFTSSKQKAK